MRIVVDSNQLQTERLRTYLAKSRTNFAVLTDYAAMEAYKGNTLESIYKSMGILCEYPYQIIILKNTRIVSGLSGRGSGLQKRLIDKSQTKNFQDYAHDLRAAKNGNLSVQRHLLELGKQADEHLASMVADAKATRAAFVGIASMYSKKERRSVRLGQRYSTAMIKKTVENVVHVAGNVFDAYPEVRNWPVYKELPNTFIFRAVLCNHLLALDWSALGGVKDASAEKLRNDYVDMSFAAYATFFDGLLSADAKVSRIHQEARKWLSSLFGCQLHGEHL